MLALFRQCSWLADVPDDEDAGPQPAPPPPAEISRNEKPKACGAERPGPAEMAAAALAVNGDFYDRLLAVGGNSACADCASKEPPTWASSNLGVVLCNECVGAHRGLGVHISKPLSLKMDAWSEEAQTFMLSKGNAAVNAELEAHSAAAASKPDADAPLETKVAFVKSKYEKMAFKAGGDGVVVEAARTSDRFSSKGQVHAGIAIVRVLKAHDLLNADDSTGLGLDKSDPYVKIISPTGKSAQTKVIDNDLNPEWNETLQLNVDDLKPLRLEVWDSDTLTADDPLGHGDIVLTGLAPGEPTKKKVELIGHPSQGWVEVEITFAALDA